MGVLIDRQTASSGESFTALASQIPGALLLGENTQGCITYGNASVVETLSNSSITVRFGFAKFNPGAVRPASEGVGMLPDYWLDDLDPEDAIAMLLGDR